MLRPTLLRPSWLALLFLCACVTGPSPYDYQRQVPRPEAALLDFALPLRGSTSRVTSLFGWRHMHGRNKVHEGIDFGVPIGTPVYAAEQGRVIYSGQGLGGFGLIVVIDHGGKWTSIYAHLSRSLVRRGYTVRKGQRIADSGNSGRSSGPHLHFEIRQGADPLDPLLFLPTQQLLLP